MDFDELSEFPRCPLCGGRDAHYLEMRDLARALTSDVLRPIGPVYAHREGECGL